MADVKIKEPKDWPYTEEDGVVPSEIYEHFLESDDTWRVKAHGKEVGRPIITHEAVERLARVFGVTVKNYEWLSHDANDAVLMIEVEGFWKNRVTPEIGEVTAGSVQNNPIAKNYPRSICWKRGYDRAVLKHLGIEAYSAEESDDFSKRNATSNKGSGGASTASKPTSGGAQQSNPNAEKPAAEGQLGAIKKTVSILQQRGADITVESLIEKALGQAKDLSALTVSEAIRVIKAGNEKMSEL